jgi:single-strand DNA-binding protein
VFETQVTVVGNVATAVKSWRLPSGDVVAKFRVASSERRRPPAGGGEWVQGDSLFVQVTCWRRLAENVLESLGVGDPVLVRGRLYTAEFEVDGRRRSETRLEAYAVGPDLTRCKAAVSRVRRADAAAGRAADGDRGGATSSGGGSGAEVRSTTGEGRAVPSVVGPAPDGSGGPPDDRGDRLGAPVEAGVGA